MPLQDTTNSTCPQVQTNQVSQNCITTDNMKFPQKEGLNNEITGTVCLQTGLQCCIC